MSFTVEMAEEDLLDETAGEEIQQYASIDNYSSTSQSVFSPHNTCVPGEIIAKYRQNTGLSDYRFRHNLEFKWQYGSYELDLSRYEKNRLRLRRPKIQDRDISFKTEDNEDYRGRMAKSERFENHGTLFFWTREGNL